MNIEELNKEYKDKMDELMKEYKEKVKELEETKEKPFIKKCQSYFYISNYFNIHETINYNYEDDIERRKIGNCYPFTEGNKDKVFEEVKLIAERRKLQSEMEMFARQNNDGKINWGNNQEKWLIYIDYDDNHVGIDKTYNYRELIDGTYFTSKEIAEKALDKFKDRIKELYINVENDNN